jgi:ribosomal protein S27AE
MSKQKIENDWEALMKEASQELRTWRQRHGRATFTEIEEEVDEKLARVRKQILQDMVMASARADIVRKAKAERPSCPSCGVTLRSEGKRRRGLITDHEQEIELVRSYASCPECGDSFFPPG